MEGNLNDVLPEPVSDETRQAIEEIIKRKMKGAAGLAVRLLHAMEDRFGPEARQVITDMVHAGHPAPTEPRQSDPREDLQRFCERLDRGCTGTHRWTRVIDESDCIGYHYTRCAWAEVFRELGEPELGFVICAGDEPAVKACNPALGFRRTQVLMNGDEVCDHVFLVERQADGD